jgi:hypothetical protein
MSVIRQLPLPPELQEYIKEYLYYTKTEWHQRKLKDTLLKQFDCCERIYWKDAGQYYDYFYYRINNWNIFKIEPNIYYITQEFQIMSMIFCKDCHQYVSSETPIPLCIECECTPEWLNVD